MNKDEAKKEAIKIFEQWREQREQAEREARENGLWETAGLDSNNHLFKEIDADAKKKLNELASKTTSD